MPLPVKARSFPRNLFLSRRVEVDLDEEEPVNTHGEGLRIAADDDDEGSRDRRIEVLLG